MSLYAVQNRAVFIVSFKLIVSAAKKVKLSYKHIASRYRFYNFKITFLYTWKTC